MTVQRDWEWAWDRARAAAFWFGPDYDTWLSAPSRHSGLDPLTAVYGEQDPSDVVADREPGKYFARCPCHADDSASLRMTVRGDGKVLMYCFAGCDTKNVLAELDLEWQDLQTPTWKR